jgi:broad specificity phosphatase PhoE
MSRVLLIRHGQASFGAEDYDRLSPLGEEQSRRLGRWFKKAGHAPDLVVTGTLRRHVQTADLCLEAAGISAPRMSVAGLDEFDHQEVLARYRPDLASGDALLAEMALSDAPQRTFQQMFAAAVSRWTSGQFDDEYARSWPTFRAAVMAGMQVLVSQEAPTIWVFTSGGPIATIVNALVGAPTSDAFTLSWPLVNTSVSRVSLGARRSALISYNGWPHLEGEDSASMVTYR